MKCRYIVELKYRIILIAINWLFLLNTSYLYKNILLFLVIKQLIYNELINFYLISTNILELLSLYFTVIYTITNNALFYSLVYNLLIFFNYALYQREYRSIKLCLYLWLTVNIGLTLFIVLTLFPIIWEFFRYYQRLFTVELIYFETKINEYYTIFFSTYLLIKYCLLTLILTGLIFKNYLNKYVLIKLRKLNLFLIISLLTVLDDLVIQLILCVFFIICYELTILCLNYKNQYYKIK